MKTSHTMNNALELAFKKAVTDKHTDKKAVIQDSMNNPKSMRDIQRAPKEGKVPHETIERAVKSVSKKHES